PRTTSAKRTSLFTLCKTLFSRLQDLLGRVLPYRRRSRPRRLAVCHYRLTTGCMPLQVVRLAAHLGHRHEDPDGPTTAWNKGAHELERHDPRGPRPELGPTQVHPVGCQTSVGPANRRFLGCSAAARRASDP